MEITSLGVCCYERDRFEYDEGIEIVCDEKYIVCKSHSTELARDRFPGRKDNYFDDDFKIVMNLENELINYSDLCRRLTGHKKAFEKLIKDNPEIIEIIYSYEFKKFMEFEIFGIAEINSLILGQKLSRVRDSDKKKSTNNGKIFIEMMSEYPFCIFERIRKHQKSKVEGMARQREPERIARGDVGSSTLGPLTQGPRFSQESSSRSTGSAIHSRLHGVYGPRYLLNLIVSLLRPQYCRLVDEIMKNIDKCKKNIEIIRMSNNKLIQTDIDLSLMNMIGSKISDAIAARRRMESRGLAPPLRHILTSTVGRDMECDSEDSGKSDSSSSSDKSDDSVLVGCDPNILYCAPRDEPTDSD